MSVASPLILVVDDEPELLSIVTDFVTLFGFDVVAANNGPEAIEIMGSQRVDAFVTDIVMPEMSGITMITELRSKGFQQPAVVYSAYSLELETLKGWEDSLGIVAKVDKPFTEEQLEAALKKAVARPVGPL